MMFLFLVNTRGQINLMIYLVKLLKGHLCYKTVLCHKVALDLYLKIFFLFEEKIMFRSRDMEILLFFCETRRFQNL